MKSKKITKSTLALFLSLIMIFSVLSPISALAISFDTGKLGDDTYLTSKTDYAVAPGVTESQIITNNSTGTNQVQGYALEVDLSNPTTSVIASYKNYDATSWGMQKLRDQAYAAEKKLGVNVVGGVNGDFFNMQTGAPTGTFVMQGTTYVKNDNWNWFAIKNDGTPIIGSGYLDTSDIKECVGGPSVLIKDGQLTPDALNSGYGTDQLPRTAVGIKADGSIILYVADGRQAPMSCGQTFLDLANALYALGCVDALCLDGGGSATLISQREGSDELECRNSPSDGTERVVSSALLVCSSAKPTGVFDHATLTPNNEVYTPGSSVQFTALGVDSSGAAVALPEDGTFALADDSFGTITADGLFTSTGKTGTVTVNYVSGGAVCGNISVEVQIPDELYVPNAEISLGFEETTDFGIVAKYQDRTVNMKAGDLTWSMTDDEGNDIAASTGTFDGLTFTTFDGITVNANVTATLVHDTSVTASIRAIIGAMPVVLYDFEYTTDAEEAAENDSLQYIPSTVMPKYDNSTYGSAGAQAAVEYENGYPFLTWPNGALNFNPEYMTAEIVSKADGEPVRFGDHSMKVTFDFSGFNNSSNGNCYLRTTIPDYTFEGTPTAFGAWIYIPEGITSTLALYLQVANKNGSTAYGIVGKTVDWTGWKYVELDLTDATAGANLGPANAPFGTYQGNGILWISYQPGTYGALTAAASIYIDNMQLVYGANTDDIDNPEVTSIRTDYEDIVDGETVLTSNVNTFKASYSDFDGKYATGIDYSEVHMYIDGVDVTDKCYINEGDEEIYFYDAELADGVHNIKVSVADKFGNTGEETRYFTVNAGSSTTKVQLVEADGAPVLGMDYVLNITADNAADILGADVSVSILSNFTRYWNNFDVVAGENYTLASAASYSSVDNSINFAVTRNADASADDNIIAQIIIHIPTDVPEGLEVTYRVTKGALTCASADSEKLVNGFSSQIVTECKSPFIITTDTMLVGTEGGNIIVTDANGAPVADVNIYTSDNELIGVTDENGKVFTDKFITEIAKFSIYAEKDGLLSFVYTGQSFPAGGSEDGMPSYIKLNASEDSETMQSISWMASPTASADKAVVLYAEKSAYEKDGDDAFKTFEGKSVVSEMASSAQILTNYAVRINTALVTGLIPDSEYVYKVGDGENMSELKSFTTSKNGRAVNFFIIGDTQANDTTNTDKITENLASSGVTFDFGIQTGDAVDNGGNYTMWSNIAKVFSGEFLSEQDLIQVLGNHEYYGDGNAHNAAAYFNLPNTEADGAAPLYYSVQYGNVYVAVINYSNVSGYTEAAEWLVKDAAASTATWKILTMHQPAYFTNPSGSNDALQGIIATAVDEAGIDFVFSGHDHSYARTEPLTAGEVDNANGAVYYICGSTGEKSYAIVDNDAHHFDCLVDDYNAIYLTVKATDTTFDITTHDYTEYGEDTIIDSYSKTKEVTCTADGHDYIYADDYLTCAVCGYTVKVADIAYTGFAKNAQGGRMYFIGGNIQTGFVSVGDENYMFDENGIAVTGKVTVDGHTYTFDSNGKLIKGSLEKQSNGRYCYYIAGEKQRGWFEIDGYWYFFDRNTGRFESCKGEVKLNDYSSPGYGMTFTFDSNGRLIKGALEESEAGTAYWWGPNPVTGLYEVDGYTYYFGDDTYMVKNVSIEIDDTVYAFGANGRFAHYGEHDFDSNGKCIKCTVGSPFWSLFQRLIAFFRSIADFFKSLFSF